MSPPVIRPITVRPNTENSGEEELNELSHSVENYPFLEGFIMTMLKKIAAVLVSLTAALLLTIGLAGTATAQTTADVDPTAAPVTGTLADATGAVTGTFDVQNFVEQNGTLQAVGTFTGTVTDAAGNSTPGHPATGHPGRPRAKRRVLSDPGPRPRTAGPGPARTAGAPGHRAPEHHRTVRAR